MSFTRLLQPRSIAVFGGAVAEEVIRQCDRMGFEGNIWPVHPQKTEILGRAVYRSVADLPASPDAAYVGVNRHLTVDIIRDLAARGAGGAICFATGFTEAGQEGAELQDRLRDACGQMPLVGPNCYGLLNYVDGAMLWPDQQGGRRVDEGIALITMSSNVAFNLTMQRRGLPIAYAISLGNRLRFDLHDAIRTFAELETVSAIGLYLEAISNPWAFADACDFARRLGKPIVALKSGRSEIARSIVLSHTASLAGSDDLITALLDRIGVARVGSLETLIEALKVLHVLGPLPGGRVGAMSTSGGDLSLIGDAMAGTGLTLAPLSTAGQARIRSTVHERIVVSNPLDYQMFDWNNEERLAETFAAFIAEDFDISLCVLDYPREDRCDPSSWNGAERGFIRASHRVDTRTGVLATFSDTMSESLALRLIDEGIVPLAGIESGLAGIQAAVDIGRNWARDPAAPLARIGLQDKDAATTVLDEVASKQLLANWNIPVPRSRVARDAHEAAAMAEALGFPVAVKTLGVPHKTEVGGVALGLLSADEVAAAVQRMEHLGKSFLIEDMVLDVVAEIIVGVARDPQFGLYLTVGGGGTLVELMRDTRSLLLPIDRSMVARTLSQLRCAPLLDGFRGRPCADKQAAVDAIVAIAAFAQERAATLIEMDINPLLLLAAGRGVVVADALIAMRSAGDPAIQVPKETAR